MKTGRTETEAVTGVRKLLDTENELIDPIPDTGNPIKGLLLVHSNCVPVKVGSEKMIFPVATPPHNSNEGIESSRGIGLTVTEKVIDAPEQALEIGVTIKTDVRETFPGFHPVNEVTVSVPLTESEPIGTPVLVQLYCVPLTGEPPKKILLDVCV